MIAVPRSSLATRHRTSGQLSLTWFPSLNWPGTECLLGTVSQTGAVSFSFLTPVLADSNSGWTPTLYLGTVCFGTIVPDWVPEFGWPGWVVPASPVHPEPPAQTAPVSPLRPGPSLFDTMLADQGGRAQSPRRQVAWVIVAARALGQCARKSDGGSAPPRWRDRISPGWRAKGLNLEPLAAIYLQRQSVGGCHDPLARHDGR